MSPPSGPFATLCCLVVAACGGARASNLARATVDTLAGGIVRVSSERPTAWTDPTGAKLIEEFRIRGEDGTPSELGEPRSVAVDDAGRIYVVDNKPAVIKVFAPDGKFVRTIGHEGEGPGEFRVGFIAVRGEHLVLHDPRLGRTSLYDTAGTFIRSWHSSCCYWTDIRIDPQDRVYIPSMSGGKKGEKARGVPYVRWTLEGKEVDTLWVPFRETGKLWTVTVGSKSGGKGMAMMSTSVPFMPELVHTLHPEGGFVLGWSGSYELVRSGTGTDSLRIIRRTWKPDPVTDERRRGEVEAEIKQAAGSYGEANVRAAFRLEDVPSTLPAFKNLRVDQSGRIWARRWAVADTTKSFFDVFDSTGAYLGPVTVPFKIPDYGNQVWTREGVVTIIEDEEGRPTIVRLKLGVAGAGN